ncbi:MULTISPECIES: hypothetical protein [Leuconostoc]|uniref:Uncharacterized protein n=2 Tax=Leuconostoc kimchii TaxID=136609 RepID=D5T355_LEUKI|nr:MULTISPECIES: hypothetical protein [Leuconostoc]ADG40704.1 hypothetical protein LKI_05815 [Leuconostoc kimchii IMSNU 11154]AEJ31319.1 hypothetical protein LGMK_06325 [Leuconostoc sp. C2]QBR47157.1 hypothetical protein EW139_03085 [Leuconostoc kimchii]
MSLIAATAISLKGDLPYFLVKHDAQGYHFFTAKMHRHNHDTSLGAVLREFKKLGPVNFDQWRLGELTSVNYEGTLMSMYSFDVPDMKTIEEAVNNQLEFVPANKLHGLLETLQTTEFVSFEE